MGNLGSGAYLSHGSTCDSDEKGKVEGALGKAVQLLKLRLHEIIIFIIGSIF